MEEDTRLLLQECESGCDMAIDCIDQIKEYVADERLDKIIEKYRIRHTRLKEECHRLLYKEGEKDKCPNPAAKAMSWVSTEMKLMIDDDEKKIAGILADGCNMGIKSISKYENEYSDASSESIRIADRLVKAEEDFAKEMREFM